MSGATAICMSGGYRDNEDMGETFVYTGAGGQDKGNKQVCCATGRLYAASIWLWRWLGITPLARARGQGRCAQPWLWSGASAVWGCLRYCVSRELLILPSCWSAKHGQPSAITCSVTGV
jgi:hypothetical protein